MTLNTALFAPMARASVPIAVTASAGLRLSRRMLWRRSSSMALILDESDASALPHQQLMGLAFQRPPRYSPINH